MRMSEVILAPVFVLVALIFSVWLHLLASRLRLIRRRPPKREDFASAAAQARYFADVDLPAANIANLFEMPVLFLALVPMLIVTGQAGVAQVVLAWVFVALRAWHSYAHIVARKVRLRFQVYVGSCLVLAAMWVVFAVSLAIRIA